MELNNYSFESRRKTTLFSVATSYGELPGGVLHSKATRGRYTDTQPVRFYTATGEYFTPQKYLLCRKKQQKLFTPIQHANFEQKVVQKFVQNLRKNLCKKTVQKSCAKSCAKICAKIVRMMTVHFLAGRENAAKKRMTEDCADTPATKLVDTPCWKPQ